MAKKCGKPLVIFFDEADCLCYDPLIAFLRQVRNGYINREETPFPASIALVGLRNIKDYRMRVRPDGASVGQASPFNIITEVMPMRIFSEDEMRALYEKSREKAYEQVARYMDRLGVPEGWLVVVDADLTKPWDGKISSEDRMQDGRAVHVFCC